MYSLIGIDPGSNYIGITIMVLDPYTLEYTDIITETIDISKVESITDNNYHIGYKLNQAYIRIKEIFQYYNPLGIIIENPFMNRRMPGAVVPLSKSLGLIEQAAIEYNPHMLIRRISPSEAKNAISARGNADKYQMADAIKNTPFYSVMGTTALTEHTIDSSAMVFDLYREVIDRPHILLQ